MGTYHTLTAALALAAIGAAMPAQAQAPAHCWAEHEVTAAQVRDMQTMLMVAALRCRAAHIDISADYDGFVTTQKAAIEQADLVIKQHFAQAGGAQADYDHFTTSLANGFGDGQTSEATCAEASALAHEASATASGALGPMALARVFPAALPGGPCAAPAAGMTLAVATTMVAARPEELPPMIALAAPPPPAAEPVTLPADVVAAMTVMARYQTAQADAGRAAVAASPATTPTETAQADEAPPMGPVQTWPVAAPRATPTAYWPTQIAAIQH